MAGSPFDLKTAFADYDFGSGPDIAVKPGVIFGVSEGKVVVREQTAERVPESK
jgi:hypothetical protein